MASDQDGQKPGAGASPTPRLVVRGDGSGGVDSVQDTAMVGAETAMASQSQAMPAAKQSSPDLMIGQVLAGRYEITAQIGRGGMGAVYEARHTLIGKRVAVKVLLDKYAEKDQVIARLEQEARLASSIGHENIIDITDFGQTNDGRRFVVMEFLEGESLAQSLAREGTMDPARAVRIARQIASALGAAHGKGVIHRDVKPENVFLIRRSGRDFVKVVDFGISKSLRPGEAEDESPRLTQTGMVLGTPLYMSPEQARGDEELDHRIDVYALGVILYECVTGEVPFRGNNYLNIISQVLSAEPKSPREIDPRLRVELEAVIMRALAKDPRERYQSMEELDNDLAALEGEGQVGATSSSFWAMRQRARQRTPARIAMWGLGVAAVLGGVAFAVTMLMRNDGAPARAVIAAADAAPAVAPPPSIDAGPAVPAIEEVTIRIESEPPGASVYSDEGARFLGKTPLPWLAVKENRTVELIFELDGYDDTAASLNPYTDHHKPVHVRLKKASRTQPRKRLRNKEPENPPEPRRDDTMGGELMGNPIKRKNDGE